MKGITSLEVDGANYYLVYPEIQNSWGTNCRDAKLAMLTSFGKEMGLSRMNTEEKLLLPGTYEVKALTGVGLAEEKTWIFVFTR